MMIDPYSNTHLRTRRNKPFGTAEHSILANKTCTWTAKQVKVNGNMEQGINK